MASYTITQITRVLNKLCDQGITTDKEISNITYGKMSEFKNISPIEKLIILEYSEALKTKQITPFLCGKKLRKNGGNKNGLSGQNTTD